MEDWSDDVVPDRASRPTLRPVFVAVLIVVACIALAVWTLQNPARPTGPAPEPEATATATKSPVRKERTAAAMTTPRPAALVPSPTPRHSEAPTAAPLVTAAATATLTASPAPTATRTVPHEPAQLSHVAPPKMKRGSRSILDVHGRGLQPEHRVMVLRGGRVAAQIDVPRQKRVGSTLIQVLVVVGAEAAKGHYDVVVADADGLLTNTVQFEVIP